MLIQGFVLISCFIWIYVYSCIYFYLFLCSVYIAQCFLDLPELEMLIYCFYSSLGCACAVAWMNTSNPTLLPFPYNTCIGANSSTSPVVLTAEAACNYDVVDGMVSSIAWELIIPYFICISILGRLPTFHLLTST